MGRRLGPEEKALWGRVMATVKPLHPVAVKHAPTSTSARVERSRDTVKASAADRPLDFARGERKETTVQPANNLDSHWDRRIDKGAVIPDISIDLHGQGLASAHARLDRALDQAIHQKLRIILLVTGKARAHDRASGGGRGAIAAVIRDWLAASRHSSAISAVRRAHPRHGGDGALYIILKR